MSGSLIITSVTLTVILLSCNLIYYTSAVATKKNSQVFVLNYYENEDAEFANNLAKINEKENEIGVDVETPSVKKFKWSGTTSTTPEMIEEAGYPAESHIVTTEDGYILTMHRIPHGKVKGSGPKDPKRIAFLQHGMFGTSADFILNSVEKSLAYMLADSGFDVWLGNSRGNLYSKNHTTLNPSFFKFWKFSWHEMGYYDLPAELDYILQTTGQADLYYVGHSMGCTMFFVLTSTRPEYNDVIRVMAAMGPAVYLNSTTSVIKFFATHWGEAEKIILDAIGGGVLLPNYINKMIHWFAPEACSETLKIDKLCDWVIALIAGHDSAQANYTQLPTILAHEPSSVSSHTAFHYFQNINSGDFRMYDPGFHDKANLPAKYDLSKVTVPVALYWGPNDILCTPQDVARFAGDLPNVVLNFRVNFSLFNHVDFLFAKDVDILVNKPLIANLQKY